VINFVRPDGVDDGEHVAEVDWSRRTQGDPVRNAECLQIVKRADLPVPRSAEHLIAPLQQQPGQIGAVLPGDAEDQCLAGSRFHGEGRSVDDCGRRNSYWINNVLCSGEKLSSETMYTCSRPSGACRRARPSKLSVPIGGSISPSTVPSTMSEPRRSSDFTWIRRLRTPAASE